MSTSKPLREAPRDPPTILSQQSSLVLPHFTATDAWNLGVSLRKRIQSLTSSPAVINITSTNSDTLIFHCTTAPGVNPDNDAWVARKRRTVKRWGVSSWYMGRKFEGDEAAFAKKFMLGEEAGQYAIHGGGVPVFVKGVEGVVAVVVVSGLKQEEDHMVVVEGLEELIAAGAVGNGAGVDAGAGEDSVRDVRVGEKAGASTEEAQVMLDEQKADGAVLAS